MENPFEALDKRLSEIERKLDRIMKKLEDPEGTDPVWMTTAEVAKYVGISKAMVTNLRTYKLPYYKLGGRILFKKQEVNEWIEKTRNKPGSEYLNEHLGIR